MAEKRALLSVSDKTGIVDFGRALAARGWTLLSTGGTAAALRDAGLDVVDVAEVTGHPEMMDGRVKTLHPAVHAGILARRDHPSDAQEMAAQGYGAIDLVAVNLYPFRETVARPDVPLGVAMGKVDIGGPTMIRAAAKNHAAVWVVVDPADYGRVLAAEDAGENGPEVALRRTLAAKVFRHMAGYDAAVASFLETGQGGRPFTVVAAPVQTLRYGENPDQEAAFYRLGAEPAGVAALEQLHGKELSYNNILDLDGALLSLAPFAFSPRPAVCIVKHTTPCGLAVGDTLVEAYRKALATDPVSAFGSVIAVNRRLDAPTAEAVSQLFVECVVAPGYDPEALALLTGKKNLRLLAAPGVADPVPDEPSAGWFAGAPEAERGAARFLAAHARLPEAVSFRSVYGGVLVQTPPVPPYYREGTPPWTVVTRRAPDPAEWDDLAFAWGAVHGVKSNAILLARGGATLGIGAGQMSRVDASRIAVQKAADAGLDLTGSVLASDAFFPFRDGVDAAAEAGVRAIVQPGGSVRDGEVIAAADEHGIAMVLTGRRLFRH
ncbi:MAG: bifunctional phosphoribosylaminoimidazolecarboxamide formyltransferase/IMP cyclohydrolase [Longimicrobiales bacterium]|nr:bifunctional phosphoribosylaminoimidazolecarboxamide formyltransferase/IMP cyclohydrolase [Longimicrobiales bacterium]